LYPAISNIKYSIRDCRKKSFSLLTSYLAKAIKIPFYIRAHAKLADVLKPLQSAGVLGAKMCHLYLFEYLSSSLNTKSRLKILTNHYIYFQNKFPDYVAHQVLKDGITCWKEIKDNNIFEIKLMGTTPEECEGSLGLNFIMNGNIIYCLAFTFCQGNQFGLVDDQIIYVTRLQGAKSSLDIISKASKFFNDNTPPTLLVSTVEGLALSLGIKTIFGINSQNQISFINNKNNHTQFYRCYDEFWETFDSVKIHTGDYLLSLPLNHKTISLIKSKHRNRTINKRKVRQELSRKTYIYFNEKLSGVRKINTSYLSVVKEVSKAKAC
jgi:uncharacterized protein VirK/YbjX